MKVGKALSFTLLFCLFIYVALPAQQPDISPVRGSRPPRNGPSSFASWADYRNWLEGSTSYELIWDPASRSFDTTPNINNSSRTGVPTWTFNDPEYSESFESETFPEGWNNDALIGNHVFEIVEAGSFPECNPVHGTHMLKYASFNASSGHMAALASPLMNINCLDPYDYKFVFSMYRDSGYASYNDRIEILVRHEGGETTLFGIIPRSRSLAPFENADGWYDYEIDLQFFAFGDHRLIIKAISGFGNNMYLDNFRIRKSLRLPLAESFEESLPPELPDGYSAIVNSSASNAVVRTVEGAANAHGGIVYLEMYNSNDSQAELVFLFPALTSDISTLKTSFWAKANSNGTQLIVGAISPDNNAYTPHQTIALTTSYMQYEVNLANYFMESRQVAFKHGGGGINRRIFIDNLVLEEIPTQDLRLTALVAPGYTRMDNPTQFSIGVSNNGSQPMSDYLLELLDADTDQVLTQHLVTDLILPGQQANTVIEYSFQEQGWQTVYARLSDPQDEVLINNQSASKRLYIFTNNIITSHIGSSFTTNMTVEVPFNFYYMNSVSETLYYPDEGLFEGAEINAIEFIYNFSQNISQTPLKVWMQNTSVQNLATDWLPIEDYQLVFDGLVNFSAGAGSLLLPLTQPFTYTGDVLGIRSNRPMDTQYFLSTNLFDSFNNPAHQQRSRFIRSDATNYDPLAMLAGNSSSVHYAPRMNIHFTQAATMFTNIMVNNLVATNNYFLSETEFNLQLNVTNTGNTLVEELDFEIWNQRDNSLVSIVTITQNILPGATALLQIPINIAEPGVYRLFALLVLDEDGVSTDNSSSCTMLQVLPESPQTSNSGFDQTVSMVNSLPFNFFYKNSVAESIYLPADLHLPYSMIYGIEYHYSFVNDLRDRELKVWMKSTTAETLSNMLPAIEGYTLVFHGFVDFHAGEHSVYLPFDEPFLYSGGNLSIRTNRVMESSFYSSSNHFKVFDAAANRSLYFNSDNLLDPIIYSSAGNLTNNVPLVTFYYVSEDLDVLASPILQISPVQTGVRLSWEPVVGAIKYRVYISEDLVVWNHIEQSQSQYLHTGSPRAFFKVVADSTPFREDTPALPIIK